MLLCSELLAIEKNIVALMFRKFVKFVNIVFKSFIRWPKGKEMKVQMTKFKQWCQLLSMQGAIDKTHVQISKPKTPFIEN